MVGARPNFMKAAPVVRALRQYPDVVHHVVHTGQHYDPSMSAAFFQEPDLPRPPSNLDAGSGSPAHPTARAMRRVQAV